MTRRTAKLVFAISAGIILLAVVGFVTLAHLKDSFFYPKPRSMPPTVPESVSTLAERLEALLQTNAPEALAGLNPGLSDERITELETAANLKLPDDFKLLYRWHNGQNTNASTSILPGHRFVPLDQAIVERDLMEKQVSNLNPVQKSSFSLFAGHRKGWLTVFDDGAGDGYFLDPNRINEPGCFFYSMSEERYYVFFPSVGNFLAGLIDCYSQGAIRRDEKTGQLEEEFEKSQPIWDRFGSSTDNE
jgi:cell wall assembly regulator SMI1